MHRRTFYTNNHYQEFCFNELDRKAFIILAASLELILCVQPNFSGVASTLTFMVLAFNVCISIWYPPKYKNHNYYLVKDFISNLLIFLGMPVAVVWRNDKMHRYILNHTRNSRMALFFKDIYYRCLFAMKSGGNKVTNIEL